MTIPWRRTVTRWAHLAAPTGFHCRQMNAAHRRQRRGLSSQASDDPAASRRHTTAEAGDVRCPGRRPSPNLRAPVTVHFGWAVASAAHSTAAHPPRTLRTRRKEAKNTSARCGVPFRYAPCASPALIRLLQCAPAESKITFLAELEILHQCSPGRSLERPITERATDQSPRKLAKAWAHRTIIAPRVAVRMKKTPPRSLADFSNLLLVVGTSGACHHHVPCGLAQSMCRASFSASCRKRSGF